MSALMLTVSMDIPMSLGVEEYEDIRAKFAAPHHHPERRTGVGGDGRHEFAAGDK